MTPFWSKARVKPLPAALSPVVFIGDPITFSWSELLKRPGLVNRGVPGETTGQLRKRFAAQVLQPGAAGVHLLAGVNDIAGNDGVVPLSETRANFSAMAALGRSRGLRVCLGSVLPAEAVFWAPTVTDAGTQILKLNRGLEADARALGISYIDYHRTLAAPGRGCGPSSAPTAFT